MYRNFGRSPTSSYNKKYTGREITMQSCIDDGLFIKEYECWRLAHAKPHYEGTYKHMVLRHKRCIKKRDRHLYKTIIKASYAELDKIKQERSKQYDMLLNAEVRRSVTDREHYHFIDPVLYDKL